MRWEVSGADARTGKDRTITIDAKDETEARALAQYNELFVNLVRPAQPKMAEVPRPVLEYRATQDEDSSTKELAAAVAQAKGAAIHFVRAAPSLPTDALLAIKRGKPARFAMGIFALFGLSMAIWILTQMAYSPSSSSGLSPTPSYSPGTSSAITSVRWVGNYGELSERLGSRFELSTAKMMDGSTKYIGEDASRNATILMTANGDEVNYAHLALILADPVYNAMMGSDHFEGTQEAKDLSLGQGIAVKEFMDAIFPAWPEGYAWALAEASRDFRSGISRSSTTRDGLRIEIDVDPKYHIFKICVTP